MSLYLKALLVLILALSLKSDPVPQLFNDCESEDVSGQFLRCKNSFSRIMATNNVETKITVLEIDSINMVSFPENQLNNLIISELYATNNKLKRITKGMFAGATIEQLRLSVNNIEWIEEDSFSSLSSLTGLWLQKNNLSKMDSESLSKALYPLTKVRSLHINDNGLVKIPDISHLISITDLQLAGNKIVDLMQTNPDKLLLPDNVVTLNLNDNSIKDIDTRAFKNLRNLKHLTLENNQISFINADTFKDLPELKTLVLNKNHLRNIPAGIVSSNFQLNRLDIASQKIPLKTIENYAFDRFEHEDSQIIVSKLGTLDLSNNNIEQLPSRMFCSRDLKSPYLSVNHFILGANRIKNVNPCIILQISRGNSISPEVSFEINNAIHIQKVNLECDCNVTAAATLVKLKGVCVKDGTEYSLNQFKCDSDDVSDKIIEMCDNSPQYNCEVKDVPVSPLIVKPGNDAFTEPIQNFNGQTVEPQLVKHQNTHTSSNNQNGNANKERNGKVTNKPSQIASNTGQNLKLSVLSVINLITASIIIRF